MNKQDLAKLALRLYADKGFWHCDLVQRIIAKTDYWQILKYELGNENTIKNDTAMLQDLAQTYGGLFTDLFSIDEIIQRHIFIPESERPVYNERYNAAMETRLGSDLYNFIIAIVECKVDIPSFFNTELKEICSLARYKFALEHNLPLDCVDCETLPDSEPLPSFEDEPILDLVTLEGYEDEPVDFKPVIEPVTQLKKHSRPEDHTVKPKPQGLQYRRSYSGLCPS
jgi:hypothetical protein